LARSHSRLFLPIVILNPLRMTIIFSSIFFTSYFTGNITNTLAFFSFYRAATNCNSS
jgi:hypothetical protein